MPSCHLNSARRSNDGIRLAHRSVLEAIESLRRHFKFYHRERLHQSLIYKTPEAVYRSAA